MDEADRTLRSPVTEGEHDELELCERLVDRNCVCAGEFEGVPESTPDSEAESDCEIVSVGLPLVLSVLIIDAFGVSEGLPVAVNVCVADAVCVKVSVEVVVSKPVSLRVPVGEDVDVSEGLRDPVSLGVREELALPLCLEVYDKLGVKVLLGLVVPLGVSEEDGDSDCVIESDGGAVPLVVCDWHFEQLGVAESDGDSDWESDCE